MADRSSSGPGPEAAARGRAAGSGRGVKFCSPLTADFGPGPKVEGRDAGRGV